VKCKGVYVVIEGIEGSGKTTHACLLHKHLFDKGLEPVLVREPGGTVLGEKARQLLLADSVEMNPLEEFLLFSLARSALHREVIIPTCAAGKIVISDRNYFSSIAYQGHGGNLNQEFVQQVTSAVTFGTLPDIIILLDAPLEEILPIVRAKQGQDRFETQNLAFFERVYQGYQQLKARAHVIIRYRKNDEIGMQEEIRAAVEKKLAEFTQNP